MKKNRVALLIGCSDYKDLKKLFAPTNDVEALQFVLEDSKIGKFDQVDIELNTSYQELPEKIERFFRVYERVKFLLFYFSGHGIENHEEGKLYFATHDTKYDEKNDPFFTTAIQANYVLEKLTRNRSEQRALILDCCYSGYCTGNFVPKASSENVVKKYFNEAEAEARGYMVLASSGKVTYSYEQNRNKDNTNKTEDKTYSIYTQALVEGLKTGSADRNEDGEIDLDELHSYVYDKVVEQKPQQQPEKSGSIKGKGGIIIAWNPNIKKKSDYNDESNLTLIQNSQLLIQKFNERIGSIKSEYVKNISASHVDYDLILKFPYLTFSNSISSPQQQSLTILPLQDLKGDAFHGVKRRFFSQNNFSLTSLLNDILSTTPQKNTPTNISGRFHYTGQSKVLYLALNKQEALGVHSDQIIIHPDMCLVTVQYNLSAVLDLTNYEIQQALKTNTEQLTSNWHQAQSNQGESFTQNLAKNLHSMRSIEGFKVPSAYNPENYNLVIFPDRLLPDSSVEIKDISLMTDKSLSKSSTILL